MLCSMSNIAMCMYVVCVYAYVCIYVCMYHVFLDATDVPCSGLGMEVEDYLLNTTFSQKAQEAYRDKMTKVESAVFFIE